MLFTLASLTLAAAVTSPSVPPTAGAAADTGRDKPAGTTTDVKADLTLASAIVDRKAQPAPEPLQAGQSVFAFTVISGPGGGFVEHVWTCNGEELAHHYLPVGPSKRWRTWSKHTLHAGLYTLRVLADNGATLQETHFAVSPAGESADSVDGE